MPQLVESTALVEITRIWKEVLATDNVAASDNFFSLGGDSVMVTIMALQVEQVLGVLVGADLVFDHPTLEGFTKAIAEQSAA
jgi:polyketide synthase PksJ